MEQTQAIAVFEALSAPVRLDVVRLLVRHAPDGLVAGDIATALNLPATNLSFHLKALAQAGLVAATPEGRFVRYAAHLALMQQVVAYLTAECCAATSSKRSRRACC